MQWQVGSSLGQSRGPHRIQNCQVLLEWWTVEGLVDSKLLLKKEVLSSKQVYKNGQSKCQNIFTFNIVLLGCQSPYFWKDPVHCTPTRQALTLSKTSANWHTHWESWESCGELYSTVQLPTAGLSYWKSIRIQTQLEILDHYPRLRHWTVTSMVSQTEMWYEVRSSIPLRNQAMDNGTRIVVV